MSDFKYYGSPHGEDVWPQPFSSCDDRAHLLHLTDALRLDW